MQRILTTLIECSVSMSVLILLLISITPLLSKRYAAKWRYYAWLVIVIGLLIPFRPHFNNALIYMDIPTVPAYTQPIISNSFETTGDNHIQTGIYRMATDPSGHPVQREIPHQRRPIIPWYQRAGALWIAGAVLFIAYHSIRHLRFLKMVKRWSHEIDDQQTLDILQDLQENLKICKQLKLQVCPCITSPMMIGFVNPVVLLPPTNYPEDELAFILRHEMIHFKRKDLWYKSLALCATAIHWFNPAVYLMAKAIAVQCEISCDAEVVKDATMDVRQQYSETIIGVIKNQSRMQTAFSTNFYGGKNGMKNRIVSIMDTTKKKTGILILCVVLMGTIGTGAVFAASANAAETSKPLSEHGGGIQTYYNPYHTLEENVISTLDIKSHADKATIRVLPSLAYIDVKGKAIDIHNRTEPYYAVEWGWKEKNPITEKMIHKTLLIAGKNVTVAFTDGVATYKDDKIIEKMITNQITFELGYHSKTYHYDHQAFINELIKRGAYVIKDVITPENFKPDVFQKQSGDFIGWKILTKYDQKDKITDIFNQKAVIPKNINGKQGVQLGNSFVIQSNETLAIDIKETTDKMPQVNWAITNETTGELIDWMPGAHSGYRFIYTPRAAYAKHTFKVVVSGEKAVDGKADFEIFTYKTGQEDVLLHSSFSAKTLSPLKSMKDSFYESVNYNPNKDLLCFTIPKTIPENYKFYLHVSGRAFMGDRSNGMSFHAFDKESESFSWINGKTYTYPLSSETLDECILVFGLIDKNGQEFLSTIHIDPNGAKKVY